MFEAVVSIVERERFGEQVRMLTQARTCDPERRAGAAGWRRCSQELSAAMVEAMEVDSFDVLLAGAPAPSLEPHTAVLEEHMREVWLRRGHVVVEPDRTWGIAEHGRAHPGGDGRADATARCSARGSCCRSASGEEYLGTMGLGRRPGGAALDRLRGHWRRPRSPADVAGVVVDARLMERERSLTAELRTVNDYRRDMVVTLAHELRNPVSVLWTHLELVGSWGSVFEPAARVAGGDGPGHATHRGHDRGADGARRGQRPGPRGRRRPRSTCRRS